MSYFEPDFLKFFRELKKNNNRDWFEKNKTRFKKVVKEPFEDFVQEMINRVHAEEPEVMISVKDAVFRIYKDVRFSKDKTPYKTHMSAIVSEGGRKDMTIPGLYFQFGAEGIDLYGGSYMLEREQLKAVREAIASNLKAFDRLLKGAKFKSMFGEIRGERHKRVPAEFKAEYEKQPLIANKQFYYHAHLDGSNIIKKDLPTMLMKYYKAAQPIKNFLKASIESS